MKNNIDINKTRDFHNIIMHGQIFTINNAYDNFKMSNNMTDSDKLAILVLMGSIIQFRSFLDKDIKNDPNVKLLLSIRNACVHPEKLDILEGRSVLPFYYFNPGGSPSNDDKVYFKYDVHIFETTDGIEKVIRRETISGDEINLFYTIKEIAKTIKLDKYILKNFK